MEDSLASSIYYPDQNIEILLSTLENSDTQPTVKEQKNQKPSEDLKNPINIDNVKYSNVNDCLVASDFPDCTIQTSFFYEAVMEKNKINQNNIKRELNQCDLNRCKRNMIYKTRTIEEMVEQTYNYETSMKYQMTEEAAYLRTRICGWRRVSGDGNCFYRSAIFSWLEYLIFNSRSDILKIVISDLDMKFNANYPNTQRLPEGVRKNFVSIDKGVVITILDIIISILNDKKNIPNNVKRIKSAYATLIKGFNFCTSFDTIMILYLRYMLYEFILKNENKIYSKDFPVLLGNLLPSQYETEDGKFLFDKYFCEDLLRFYTCAEKLAVYLAPFVLKANLEVYMYDFGKNCDIQKKTFTSFLPNKDTIFVLYRKAHYDICYTEDYVIKYIDFLPMFSSDKADLLVINIKEVNQKVTSLLLNQDVMSTKIYNKQKIIEEMNKPKEKKEEKREEVKQEEKKQEEPLSISYLMKKINCLTKCYECDSVYTKEEPSDKNKMPCGCNLLLCCDDCVKAFEAKLKYIVTLKIMNNENAFICHKCQIVYNRTQFLQLVSLYDNLLNGATEIKKEVREQLNEIFTNTCMKCLKTFEPKDHKHIVGCKAETISYLMGSKLFRHYLCSNCKKTTVSTCQICGIYHFRIAKENLKDIF